MNLQKITGTQFSCMCSKCQAILHHPKNEVYADLEGAEFKAFYCLTCLLKPGTQIIYVPTHADGIHDEDTESGFVTNVTQQNAFCRYWSKSHAGLRTTANSELTPIERLVIKDTRKQSVVDELMKKLYPDIPKQAVPASRTPFKDDQKRGLT